MSAREPFGSSSTTVVKNDDGNVCSSYYSSSVKVFITKVIKSVYTTSSQGNGRTVTLGVVNIAYGIMRICVDSQYFPQHCFHMNNKFN